VSAKNTKWKRPNGESRKTTTRTRDSTTSQKFTGNCPKCGKKGHRAKDCWSKGANGKKKSGNTRGGNMDRASIMDEQIWLTEDIGPSRGTRTARFCSVLASTQHSDSRNSNANDMQNEIDKALSSYTDHDEPTWVLDSGCTNHMTSRKDIFLEGQFTTLQGNKRQIRTATGELVPAAGVRNIRIPIWLPGRGKGIIQLCDVLYIPGAGITNLISVSQLTVRGMNVNFHHNRAEVYMDRILSGIAIKAKHMYTLVHKENRIDEVCTVIYEETDRPTIQSKATKICSVMASTRDSDSRNSGPSRNTPGGGKADDPIQALQDVLQRSCVRRGLALEREASIEAGPADGYETPVVRNRKKPPMTAAEKHEKTVNALRTGLGKYWEGRGISKSYEAEKRKGRDNSEPKSTSDTSAQAGAATEKQDEEEDEDDEPFFEPDLIFMVNDAPNTIEKGLRGADNDH